MNMNMNAYRKGNYREALRIGEAKYCQDPSDIENLLLLAACQYQLNNTEESKFYAQQVLGVKPALVEGHVAVARCLVKQGQVCLAADVLNKAIRIQPRFADSYALLGCIRLQQKCAREASNCFEMAISLKPNLVEAISNLVYTLSHAGEIDAAHKLLKKSNISQSAILLLAHGNFLYKNHKDFHNAARCYSRAIELEPSFHDAEINLCASLVELYKTSNDQSILENAIVRLDRMISEGVMAAHRIRGVCRAMQGQCELAINDLQHSIRFGSSMNSSTLCNLGGQLFKKGCLQQSITLCFKALEVDPNCAQAFNLLGIIMFQMEIYPFAHKCFQIAQNLQQDNDSYCRVYIGAVLLQQGQPLAAAKMFKKAIVHDPSMFPAFLNLGNAYFQIGNYSAAEKCYQTCIDSKANYASVALINQMLLHLSLGNVDDAAEIAKTGHVAPEFKKLVNSYSCKWDALVTNQGNVKGAIDADDHILAYCPRSSVFQLRENQHRLHETRPSHIISSNKKASVPKSNERIKIAYMSSGFGNHTNGFLTQSIFSHHDKTKFSVQAISLSPCDHSSEWAHIEACVNKLMIVGNELNSIDLANQIRDDRVHILVDLDGQTNKSRPEVFAMKPAPIQISMLGQFCSSGYHGGIDYIVADSSSLPSNMFKQFNETVIDVPHIVNSYRESKSCDIDFDTIDRYQIREKFGISEETFVYACFAQPYKLTPDVFAVWMEILKAVPNSQLILIRYSRAMVDNLREEMTKHSVALDRVIFWDLASRHEHMIRSCIADAILDTICSGVATSYDAIWTNTPLVTIAGDIMSHRLGASLLSHIGLDDELVASNLEEYKKIAISLSEDEDKYMDILRVLEDTRDESDLFDCKLWVQSFENELQKCIDRHNQK